MLIYLYRFLINVVFILSPIIIISRLTKKKEDFKRIKGKKLIQYTEFNFKKYKKFSKQQ